MLAEFALLPSVFDARAHPDVAIWMEELRELGRGMFPRNVGCPVLIADLQDGEWWKHAVRIVNRMPEGDSRRSDLKSLLTKIKSVAVRRPGKRKKLVSYHDWAREIVLSHKDVAFERIVGCRATVEELRQEADNVWELCDVPKDRFWEDISPDLSPPLNIKQQVEVLRKVCLHADFLWLVSPYIKGQDDDETKFAVALVRRALQRPEGYSSPIIEVHVEGLQGSAHENMADALQHKVNNIKISLSDALKPGQEIKISVVVKPKFCERYLIGGLLESCPSGIPQKRPRWGFHFGHVARPGDARRGMIDTEWKLLNESRLRELFERFAALPDAQSVHSISQ